MNLTDLAEAILIALRNVHTWDKRKDAVVYILREFGVTEDDLETLRTDTVK